jgi:hypothetical protein
MAARPDLLQLLGGAAGDQGEKKERKSFHGPQNAPFQLWEQTR